MVVAYIVRCNFTAPAHEAAWNAWYSGPKIPQMLSKPYFRTCQRFRRVAGSGRDYLALWTLTSPKGMTTPEYTAQWGFREWEQYVTDWSRDLFDGGASSERDFAVAKDGALDAVSFDGASADVAAASRASIAPSLPDMMWLPMAGLDRHTPVIGLRVLGDLASSALPPRAGETGIQEALYRPIVEQQRRQSP
jgi:hypothetical protein